MSDEPQPAANPIKLAPGDIVAAIASIPPGLNWLIGRGVTRPDEPLYGCQILDGEDVIAQAEHDDCGTAIHLAVALLAPVPGDAS